MEHNFWPRSPFCPFIPSFPGPPGYPGSPRWKRRKQTRVKIPIPHFLDIGLNRGCRPESPGCVPGPDTHTAPHRRQTWVSARGAELCTRSELWNELGGPPKHPALGRQNRKGICAQMITITSFSCEGNLGSDWSLEVLGGLLASPFLSLLHRVEWKVH